MPKKAIKELIVGLDIGTTKIVVLVGEINPNGTINIIGIGTHPSDGLKKGMVVNIESTVQSIQYAIEEAELMAGHRIHSAHTGIAGSHIRSLNSNGIVAIHNQEVTQADINRVIDAAKAVAIPSDQQILHILPQEFVIDKQEGIREPIGMSGVRLESKVHIITGAVSAVQNIIKCVQKCGLSVEDIVLEQLASSCAVLTEDERELGVCLVDIGGGTTDIAVFINGAIRHTAVIPIAGDQVTNDIAVALRTPFRHAESIKVNHASANAQLANQNNSIAVPSAAQRSVRHVSQYALAQVVEARYAELFSLIHRELKQSGMDKYITSGIVLTGGASYIDGGIELAKSVFQMPVRLGIPHNITDLPKTLQSPIYATSVGLLLHGQQHSTPFKKHHKISNKNVFKRMKQWFQRNF